MAPKKAVVAKKGAGSKRGGKEVAHKKQKRAKKDPNAPKRALTAYMFFFKDERMRILDKNPELSKDIGQTGSKIGAAWNGLSASAKEPYTKLAAKDAERYKKEMAAYQKKH